MKESGDDRERRADDSDEQRVSYKQRSTIAANRTADDNEVVLTCKTTFGMPAEAPAAAAGAARAGGADALRAVEFQQLASSTQPAPLGPAREEEEDSFRMTVRKSGRSSAGQVCGRGFNWNWLHCSASLTAFSSRLCC